MRVLFLGGTRFIGRRAVEALAARGHAVTVFSRGGRRPAYPAGVDTVWGDRDDPAARVRAFAGERYDRVVDNTAYGPGAVEAMAASGRGRFGAYLLTSTAWVYLAGPPSPDGGHRERSLWPGTPAHAAARAAVRSAPVAEATRGYVDGKLAAEAEAFGLDVPVAVLRPGMVAGAGDHNGRVQFYARRVRERGPLLLPDGGTREFPLLFVEDLADVLVRLVEREPAEREVFNAAPEESASTARIAALLEAAAGVRGTTVEVDGARLRAAYPEYAAYEPFAGPEEGSYDTSELRRALPGARFTPLDAWVGAVPDDAAAEAGYEERRARERAVARAAGWGR